MSIGNRVREARKRLNMSQAQLALKVGIKQPTLSGLETGESEGTAYIASLASALGVNALWLETGKGDARLSNDARDASGETSGRGLKAVADIPDNYIEAAQLAKLIDLFSKATREGRSHIIVAAESVAKSPVSHRRAISKD